MPTVARLFSVRVRFASWAFWEKRVPTRSPGTHQLARIAVSPSPAKLRLDAKAKSGDDRPDRIAVAALERGRVCLFSAKVLIGQRPRSQNTIKVGPAGLVRTAFNQATDPPASLTIYLSGLEGCGVIGVARLPGQAAPKRGLQPASLPVAEPGASSRTEGKDPGFVSAFYGAYDREGDWRARCREGLREFDEQQRGRPGDGVRELQRSRTPAPSRKTAWAAGV